MKTVEAEEETRFVSTYMRKQERRRRANRNNQDRNSICWVRRSSTGFEPIRDRWIALL